MRRALSTAHRKVRRMPNRAQIVRASGGLLLGSVLAFGTADAASLPVLPTCGNSYYDGKVRPRAWSSGCTGGSLNTKALRWSRWRSVDAVGSGTLRFNDCRPSCAERSVRSYRVTLRASRVRECYTKTSRRRMFTRVRYTSTAPGAQRGTFSLSCAQEPFKGRHRVWRPAGRSPAPVRCPGLGQLGLCLTLSTWVCGCDYLITPSNAGKTHMVTGGI